jgi:hypothetical protein
VAVIYQNVVDRVPWDLTPQSPRGPGRLDIDKLTIYCGDKMLVPDGDKNKWFNGQTQHVIEGGDHHHHGDAEQRFCRLGDSMVSLWTTHPEEEEPKSGRIVIICEGFFESRSFDTRQVRAATVREAIAQNRLNLGMPMDWISREVVLSPFFLHEMFHVALDHAGSK